MRQSNVVTALDDPRSIKAITMQGTNERDGDYYTTKRGVTIVAYGESGLYGNLLWFAVIKDGDVVTRLNGMAVETIEYDLD